MEEQVVEEVVEEQVAQALDTTELEAAYLQARDTYVEVRDAYSKVKREGAKTERLLEEMLSKREKYVAAYTALEMAGVRPSAPPKMQESAQQ